MTFFLFDLFYFLQVIASLNLFRYVIQAVFGTWFKQLTANRPQLNGLDCLNNNWLHIFSFGNKSTNMWSHPIKHNFSVDKSSVHNSFLSKENVVMRLLTTSLSLLLYPIQQYSSKMDKSSSSQIDNRRS